jgi:hypothetical protein
MAKKIVKRVVAPRRGKEPDLEKGAVDKIKQVHLEDAADREYYEYGVAVISPLSVVRVICCIPMISILS